MARHDQRKPNPFSFVFAAGRTIKGALFGFPSVGVDRTLVPVPSGFSWNPGIPIYQTGTRYTSDLDVSVYKPAVAVTYYVDPTNGSDAASGLTRLLPLKSLSVAIAKADVDAIVIINLTADKVVRSTVGWGPTGPTRDFSIINETPQYRYIIAGSSSTVNNWTQNGTYSNVFNNARGTAGISLVDTAMKFRPFRMYRGGSGYAVNDVLTLPNGGKITVNSVSASGAILAYGITLLPINTNHLPEMSQVATTGTGTGAKFTTLSGVPLCYHVATKQASVAAVAANPGSFYDDGTNVYYSPVDGLSRVGSRPEIVIGVANDPVRVAGANTQLYMSGIDIVGGQRGFYANSASLAGSRYAFWDVSFQGGGSASGVNIAGNCTAYFQNCGAYFNFQDGFNFHSFESDGTTPSTSPKEFLSGCASLGNGTTGSSGTSDNGFTAHDDCDTICLNCTSCGEDDRPFAFVNLSRTWVVGGHIMAPAKAAASEELVSVQDTARLWLEGVDVAPAASQTERYGVTSAATLFHKNITPTPTTSTAGKLQGY